MMMIGKVKEVGESVNAIVKWPQMPLEPWSVGNLEVEITQFRCSLKIDGSKTHA